MNLNDCYNFNDFRKLAKKNLPAPIFHYIDGGSDDETTLKRNTESFLKCDLVPNILASVGEPDLSTSVLGQKINMPLFLANVSANFFQLFPKPLLTVDQLKLLKYDNIPSGKYKTNLEINIPSRKFFEVEVKKYCYMWKDGGQFSTEKYKSDRN